MPVQPDLRGSRKSTPYAAQMAAEKAITTAKDYGLARVDVLVKGVGSGRESAIRAMQATGIIVTSIKDVTGIRTTAAVHERQGESNGT